MDIKEYLYMVGHYYVATLLYNSKCPFVCLSVNDELGGNLIFSDRRLKLIVNIPIIMEHNKDKTSIAVGLLLSSFLAAFTFYNRFFLFKKWKTWNWQFLFNSLIFSYLATLYYSHAKCSINKDDKNSKKNTRPYKNKFTSFKACPTDRRTNIYR